MDLKSEMIVLDNKIITREVKWYKYDTQKNIYYIKYKKSSRLYSYSKYKIIVIENPKLISLDNYNLFLDNSLMTNITEVYEFSTISKSFYHIVFENNKSEDYSDERIKKINKNLYNVIDYLKEVSSITSLSTENGEKILCNQMSKIRIDSLDTALSNYLKLTDNISRNNNIETLIFPFGCNESQYKAVANAIYNKISVIEGPPGTGKTQTILNIIANIIVRDMNCQVVSNNNSAIENIEEKLKKYDLDFFEALLGKNKNKNDFIENQKEQIPSFYEYTNININEIKTSLNSYSQIVQNIYNCKRKIAVLTQQKDAILLEYEYFKQYLNIQNIKLVPLKRKNHQKLNILWNELLSKKKLSIFNKIKYILIYEIGDFKFYNNSLEIICNTIQNEIYINQIDSLERDIIKNKNYVDSNKQHENKFIKLSMDYLKKYLSSKYSSKRKVYTQKEIWKNSREFINDYPVILSTTYSSRNTFNNEFRFDYIIMDEASQIDVATGTLALSSAKNAVIIGDEMQLPNVVTEEMKIKLDKVFSEYKIDNGYSYSLNSFLSSVKRVISNIEICMLQEHYRCHPKIINFCNKKFYNNNLIIMTEDKGEKDVVKVIKTNKGNHSRDKTSQRQLDIIKELLPELTSNDIGIIAPYNSQVDLIKKNIDDIEVSTVHKFQGREKDVIIISTVDDDISDFVANSNILNVAISRAKKQLIFIVTGNEINNKNIKDFIDYVQYNNMEISESKIYSVFDLLYKQNELERINFYKKHNKVLKYDSENFIYYMLQNITKDYKELDFIFHQPLRTLIIDKSQLTEREKQYASHYATHIDFLIFNKISKQSVLAIEVDGYHYHKDGTKQHERDSLKNSILEKYNIPLIRLETNGSGEEVKIRNMLDKITK